jgi:hypothetical protein
MQIYEKGLFKHTNRGGMLKANDTTRSSAIGTLKSNMPVGRFDPLQTEARTHFSRGADNSEYNENALWVQANFNKMVHPFSNSISGTILCLLRVSAYLNKKQIGTLCSSAEAFKSYFMLLTSTMLLASGGHSLYEYTAALSLIEVLQEFASVPGFETVTMESMFLGNNEAAFNAALDETLFYNQLIINRQQLNKNAASIPLKEAHIPAFDFKKSYMDLRKTIQFMEEVFKIMDNSDLNLKSLKKPCLQLINDIEWFAEVDLTPFAEDFSALEDLILDEMFQDALNTFIDLKNNILNLFTTEDVPEQLESHLTDLKRLIFGLNSAVDTLNKSKIHFDQYISLWNTATLGFTVFQKKLDDITTKKLYLKPESIIAMRNELALVEKNLDLMQERLKFLQNKYSNPKFTPILERVSKHENHLKLTYNSLQTMKDIVKNLKAEEPDINNDNDNKIK